MASKDKQTKKYKVLRMVDQDSCSPPHFRVTCYPVSFRREPAGARGEADHLHSRYHESCFYTPFAPTCLLHFILYIHLISFLCCLCLIYSSFPVHVDIIKNLLCTSIHQLLCQHFTHFLCVFDRFYHF